MRGFGVPISAINMLSEELISQTDELERKKKKATFRPFVGNWWMIHTNATVKAVVALKKGDKKVAEAIMTQMKSEAHRWAKLVANADDPYPPSDIPRDEVEGMAYSLMIEHINEVGKAAVASFSGNDAELKKAGELLAENATAQEKFYGTFIQGFGENQFISLMKEHLRMIFAYIGALINRDKDKFRISVNIAQHNARVMDDFFNSMFTRGGSTS